MEKQGMIMIDVEKIMEEIRKEIEDKGYTDDLPELSDISCTIAPSHKGIFDLKEFQSEVQYLNEHWNVAAYRQLNGWGKARKIKTFIKKVIRKCMRFYIEPIVEDQNCVNAKITTLYNMVNLYIAQMQEENEKLKKRVEQLEKEKK